MSSSAMNEHIAQLSARLKSLLHPLLPKKWQFGASVVPVVRLSGVIGFTTPLRPGLTLAGVAPVLDRAFKLRGARAVALIVNSPGGSAVQSHLIYSRICLLSAEAKLPVIAFVEDVAASGGYMIACAGHEIVCDPSSIVGSIGVVGASFGFDQAIRKLGIERRVYTSGEHKLMLDPFQPEKPEDVAHLKTIQREIHNNFIALVKGARGPRLTGPENILFSGEYWTATTALGFGLVDRLGDIRSVLRERFGEDVKTPVISAGRSLLGRLLPGMFSRLGADQGGTPDEIISALEARALWARYGL
jgi:serine protease SohB